MFRPTAFLAYVLTLGCAVILAACGGSASPTASPSPVPSTSTPPPAAPAATPSPTVGREAIKVPLSLDGTSKGDLTALDFAGGSTQNLAEMLAKHGITSPAAVTVHGWKGTYTLPQPTAIARTTLNLGQDGSVLIHIDSGADIGPVVKIEAVAALAVTQSGQQAPLLEVTVNGQPAGSFNLQELRTLPTGKVDTDQGPSVTAVLEAAGVTEYQSLDLAGLARGRQSAATLTLSKQQADAGLILVFTNQNTVRMASASVSRDRWVIDISKISVMK